MNDVNLSPQVISRILGEIRELNRNPADGIEFIDNDENSVSEVHAIISGPEGTPFHLGKFRLKLVLSHEYPAAPPRGFFLTKIYHPNVSSNGDICVNTLKKDWSPETTLKHVLQVIRCLLIVPFPESSLNDEAGKLFMDSYDQFARRARLMTNVHAIDETEENDGGATESPSLLSGGAKVAAGEDETLKDVDLSKILAPTEMSLDKIQQKKTADKSKDAKKKSLKRL
jgi:ubiquitin-conjugating enzyme E2 S